MTSPQRQSSEDKDPVDPLQVELTPLNDITTLARRWQALELKSDRSFFLSWHWIGAWVEGLQKPPLMCAIKAEDGSDIALGLFTETHELRHGLVSARQLVLHATGNPAQDVITIEYNSLLCARQMEEQAWSALLQHLKSLSSPTWNEIVILGTTTKIEKITHKSMPRSYRKAETGSYLIDLSTLRRQGIQDHDGYLATLSKNTRNQIRRSLNLYKEQGPVTLERAQTIEQAHNFLEQLHQWHEAKWQERGITSVLSNKHYIDFHHRLLETGLKSGQIEILRARAGDHIFGGLYNFVDRGNVYFYFSGFRSEDDNRRKPGLTTHALAIEDHLKKGSTTYDFMAGDDRYKKSLGEPGPDIITYTIQKPEPALLLEGLGRRLKSQFQGN